MTMTMAMMMMTMTMTTSMFKAFWSQFSVKGCFEEDWGPRCQTGLGWDGQVDTYLISLIFVMIFISNIDIDIEMDRWILQNTYLVSVIVLLIFVGPIGCQPYSCFSSSPDAGRLILYCKRRLKVYFKFARVLSPSRPYQALTKIPLHNQQNWWIWQNFHFLPTPPLLNPAENWYMVNWSSWPPIHSTREDSGRRCVQAKRFCWETSLLHPPPGSSILV